MVTQRVGPARLAFNADNLFDVRPMKDEPFLLPHPGLGGRRTVTPWGPVDGRVLSLGALIDF